MNEFNQLAVWQGITLDEGDEADLTEFFKENFDSEIQFAERVWTLPDMEDGEPVPDTGGRCDLFFFVKDSDIPTFAVKRFALGDDCPRWWEDVLGNGHGKIYPSEILAKYPKTW